MTATQVALIVLVVVAFVVGWFARGRRDRHGTTASASQSVAEIDAAIARALTSFQAVLATLQLDDAARSSLAARAIRAFQQRCAVVSKLAADPDVPAGAQEALRRASAELERLAEEVSAHDEETPLGPERERRLLSVERRVASARSAFLLGMTADSPAADSTVNPPICHG